MFRMIAVAAVAAVFAPTAVAQETAATEMARVRFIHAVPGAPAVSVRIGNQELFSSVSYREVTELKRLSGRSEEGKGLKVFVTPAGGTPIESQREHEFDDTDEDYSILASPQREGGGVEVTVFKLDQLEPDAKEAQVTLVNAVPDVRALDLYVDQKKVHAGVNYKGHNGPDKVEAGPHSLSVKTADEQVVMQPRMVNLRPGQSYTVFAVGSMAGGVEAVVVEDALGGSGASMEAGAGAAATTGTVSGSGATTPPM